jgi:hypothetical protein
VAAPELFGQRPLQRQIVERRNFMSFTEIEGAFDRAAEVVGSGRHLQVKDDGIEAINDGFGKAQNDGAFFRFHDDGSI